MLSLRPNKGIYYKISNFFPYLFLYRPSPLIILSHLATDIKNGNRFLKLKRNRASILEAIYLQLSFKILVIGVEP